jgi:AraC-like DNA-binding protein
MDKVEEDVHVAPFRMPIAAGIRNQPEFIDDNNCFHIHDDYEIFLLISSRVSCWVGGVKYDLSPGSVLVMNSREIHKGQNESGRPFKRFSTHFLPEIIAPFCWGGGGGGAHRGGFDRKEPSLGDPNLRRLEGPQLEKMLNLAQELCRALNEDREEDAPYQRSIALSYLVQMLVLVNKAFQRHFNAAAYKVRLEPKIHMTIEYIDSHLDDSLTLDRLASKIAVSKYYLCHEFKAVTGISIHQYILMKRIAKAKKLLYDGLSAGDVCGRVGFTDYSSFVYSFKKITGVSPVKFRGSPKTAV